MARKDKKKMNLLTPELKAELDKHVGKNVTELNREGELFREMSKAMLEYLMKQEMTEKLGYEKHQSTLKGNARNGYNRKTVKSAFGHYDLETPRDRDGTFEPKAVNKYQTDVSMFDEPIISMYSKGMSDRDIQDQIKLMWGVDLSPSSISNVTNSVIEFVKNWQNRPLESIYAIVYFDAIHYKIRSNGLIESKAAYTCLGIDLEGKKDILGIWIGESESSKFWLSICNELKNRGVNDILIACLDGLKGLPDAINTTFPKTDIQLCIVHMIRNSMKFVASKYEKEFMADLKHIYKAPSETIAHQALDSLVKKWADKYPSAVNPWVNHWSHLATFFKFPHDVRRLIYTTNSVEALHRQFRKVTKSKSVFPNDQALLKMLYLASCDIVKKWKLPALGWRSILAQLHIFFEGRVIIN